jgi:rod shape-determining protein MreB
METLSQTSRISSRHSTIHIYLAGGGSMLRGLDKRISKNRLTCLQKILYAVVRGTGMALKTFRNLKVS